MNSLHHLHRKISSDDGEENEPIAQNLVFTETMLPIRRIETVTIVVMVASFFIGFIILLSIYLLTISTIPISNLNIDTITKNPHDIKVTLFGDSLIRRAYAKHNLGGKINSFITGPTSVSFYYNQGIDADTIKRIAARIDTVMALDSQALILVWDSDVSDADESVIPIVQVQLLRYNYELNVRYVLKSIQAKGVYILGLGGPGILGEISNRHPSWAGKGKESMLDTYRDINIRICAEYGITYFDLRTALQNAILAANSTDDNGYVTDDGEHLNDRGTMIAAQLYAQAINKWLRDNF